MLFHTGMLLSIPLDKARNLRQVLNQGLCRINVGIMVNEPILEISVGGSQLLKWNLLLYLRCCVFCTYIGRKPITGHTRAVYDTGHTVLKLFHQFCYIEGVSGKVQSTVLHKWGTAAVINTRVVS